MIADWVQVVNGVAAAIAALVWARAMGPSRQISGELSSALTAVLFAVCIWYASWNLLLGFGLVELEIARAVPVFRYAFAPVVLLPALRHVSQRRVRRTLLAVVRVHKQEGNHEGGPPA